MTDNAAKEDSVYQEIYEIVVRSAALADRKSNVVPLPSVVEPLPEHPRYYALCYDNPETRTLVNAL